MIGSPYDVSSPPASFRSLKKGIAAARPLLVLAVIACGCSIYANLSRSVTDPYQYRYFPPFQPNLDFNFNGHLGAEYFHIAQALRAGEGFAHPFEEKTGPTAWMPPVLPVILAGLLWVCQDDRDTVVDVVIGLQVAVLIGTGLLVLELARRSSRRVGTKIATLLFVLFFLLDFFLWFQFTHDSWLVLLVLDLLVAGLCWLRPFDCWQRSAGWGVFGGLCALISPVAAFTWGITTFMFAVRKKAWTRLAVTGLCAALCVSPWLIRNYLVFGVWIPVKSNLAYELYQSQCVQPDGLVRLSTFAEHPYTKPGLERTAYREMGEIAFMEVKGRLFREALSTDPADVYYRVKNRLMAATLWYEPFWDEEIVLLPEWVNLRRLFHPWPALALLFLVASSCWRPLRPLQWLMISIYVLFLLPFIVISYYDRYAAPLLPVKALLVIWAIDRLLAGLSLLICHLPWRRAAMTIDQ